MVIAFPKLDESPRTGDCVIRLSLYGFEEKFQPAFDVTALTNGLKALIVFVLVLEAACRLRLRSVPSHREDHRDVSATVVQKSQYRGLRQLDPPKLGSVEILLETSPLLETAF
jgi:hypothetical protein